MLKPEAQKKYNIKVVKKGSSNSYFIRREDFERIAGDYITLMEASRNTGLSTNILLRWKTEWPEKAWPTSTLSGHLRVNYQPPEDLSKLKWQQKEEQQLKIQADWEHYTGKAVIIGCPHFPFVDVEYLNDIVNIEGGNLGRVIFSGDVLDFSNISLFRKEYNISPLQEVREAIRGISAVKQYSERIILLNANHDNRFQKRLAERLSPDLNELDEAIRDGLTPTEYVAEQSSVDGTSLWYIRLGNVIICHPERGVTAKLGTVKRAADFWTVRQTGIDAVILSHTHQIGSMIYRKCLCAETGCLTKTPDYTMAGNIGAQTDLMYAGYFRSEWRDGMMDIHKSHPVYLGPTR